MKKIFIPILLIAFCNSSFPQWQLSLTMKANESIAGISSPTNNVIWTITNNFFIYLTINGGNNWSRIKCKGLAANISLSQLYVLNASTAFLSVSENTGVGPGLIYKTTDSGRNWKQVFSHPGTCNILIGMFNSRKGLMACSFSSFDGSVKSGQTLYATNDSGNNWVLNAVNPARSAISTLEIKDKEVCITDYSHFYYSSNQGISFQLNDHLPDKSSQKNYLQFEDSNYAVVNSGNLIDLLVKRPGTGGWLNIHKPPELDNGAVTGIVLDDNECWITEAFDTNKLYYSSDSAKTFTATIPLSNSSFQYLTKARKGRTLIGGTPSFMRGKIYINKRTSTGLEYPVAFINKSDKPGY